MDIKDPSRNERLEFHKRGVKIVLVAALMGIIAGVVSSPLILSQPIYAPIIQDGKPAFQDNPVIMLANASILQYDASHTGGSFVLPDSSELLKNASRYVANASVLMPGATVHRTYAVITSGDGSIVNNGKSVVMSNVTVTLQDTAAVPPNASVLLTNGAVIMPGASDKQSDATVILGSTTFMLTNPHAPDRSSFAFLILAICIYLQKFILPLFGIDASKHGFKDWFFVSFLTFCFWFMTWTILLNGPVPFGPFF